MADKTFKEFSAQENQSADVKMADMGDGTWARVVKAILGAGSALIGKVQIRNSTNNADIDPLAEGTFTGRVGEVQATPTANTILARLKDLLTGIVLAAGTNTIGATRDAGPSWTQSSQFSTSADMTGAADLTAAPTSGQKIVVDDIIISADTAMYVSFLEETSGTEVLRVYLSANSPAQITPRGKLKLPVADKKLRGDASVAGNIAVTVLYHSEA